MERLTDRQMLELHLVGLDIPENAQFNAQDIIDILPKELIINLEDETKNHLGKPYKLKYGFEDYEELYKLYPEDRDNPFFAPYYYAAYEREDVRLSNGNTIPVYSGYHGKSDHNSLLKCLFELLKDILALHPDKFKTNKRHLPCVNVGKMTWQKCLEITDGLSAYELLFISDMSNDAAMLFYEQNQYRDKGADSGLKKHDIADEIFNITDTLYRSYKQKKECEAERAKLAPYRIRRLSKTYLMRDENTGCTKIGKSVNPRRRERTLLSDKPTITLFKVCEKNVERELHAKYKDKRVRGEWFTLTEEDIADISKNYNFYEYDRQSD